MTAEERDHAVWKAFPRYTPAAGDDLRARYVATLRSTWLMPDIPGTSAQNSSIVMGVRLRHYSFFSGISWFSPIWVSL